MAETTKLHISRIRKRGEPDWFDAQTDIRKIIPRAFCESADALLDMHEPGDGLYEDFLYIRACIDVFRIRILEDDASVSQQIREFFDAIGSVNREAKETWLGFTFTTLTCVFALFCRRDSTVDREQLKSLMEYGRLCSLKDLLSDGTWKLVKDEIKNRTSLLEQRRLDADAMALCLESGELVDHIQVVASKFISASGDRSWNALAEACDKQFSTPGGKSTAERIALGLAYPTYKNPSLDLEMESEDGSIGAP